MTHLIQERCIECDDATGRAGRGDDSLYRDCDETGPYCPDCADDHVERCKQCRYDIGGMVCIDD